MDMTITNKTQIPSDIADIIRSFITQWTLPITALPSKIQMSYLEFSETEQPLKDTSVATMVDFDGNKRILFNHTDLHKFLIPDYRLEGYKAHWFHPLGSLELRQLFKDLFIKKYNPKEGNPFYKPNRDDIVVFEMNYGLFCDLLDTDPNTYFPWSSQNEPLSKTIYYVADDYTSEYADQFFYHPDSDKTIIYGFEQFDCIEDLGFAQMCVTFNEWFGKLFDVKVEPYTDVNPSIANSTSNPTESSWFRYDRIFKPYNESDEYIDIPTSIFMSEEAYDYAWNTFNKLTEEQITIALTREIGYKTAVIDMSVRKKLPNGIHTHITATVLFYLLSAKQLTTFYRNIQELYNI